MKSKITQLFHLGWTVHKITIELFAGSKMLLTDAYFSRLVQNKLACNGEQNINLLTPLNYSC